MDPTSPAPTPRIKISPLMGWTKIWLHIVSSPIEFLVSASRILCLTECCLWCQKFQAFISSSWVLPSLQENVQGEPKIWYLLNSVYHAHFVLTRSCFKDESQSVVSNNASLEQSALDAHVIILDQFMSRGDLFILFKFLPFSYGLTLLGNE